MSGACPADSATQRQGWGAQVVGWSAVAAWRWETPDATCGICQSAYEEAPPGVKWPGDEAPPVSGACKHTFHMQCIARWLSQREAAGTEPQCPLCRATWEFAGATDEAAEQRSTMSRPALPASSSGTSEAEMSEDSLLDDDMGYISG